MQVKDFNAANELPIGSYCYVITRFLPNTFAEEMKYLDMNRNEITDSKVVERYRKLVDLNFDFRIQYESFKLIGVKNDYFVLESAAGEIEENIRYIFLTREDMESFWEQHVSAWKKEKEDTILSIKSKYPKLSEKARACEVEELENNSMLTDEEKQAIIDRY